jgi:3-hydroxyacyl-CoA dehydrogenase
LVGRLPMAGGVQMLARLIGAADALRLIGQAGSIDAAEAVALGVVDRIVAPDDLILGAMNMALSAPAADRAPGLRDAKGYQAALVAARSKPGDALMAALTACVEAAQLLPLEQGLAFEAALADEVAARPEAAALRHLMMADMRMVADLAGGQAARKLGLWGAAGTGAMILPALRAGFDVVLADDDRPALLQAVERVAMAQEEQVLAGRLTGPVRDMEWARLHPAVAASDLQGCDLVIAAKPGAKGAVVLLGAGGAPPAGAPRLHLLAPGFAEYQAPPGLRGFNQTAAATLRQMRMRLAVTDSTPATGVARTLISAAQQAMSALQGMGAQPDALRHALSGVMRVPVPPLTARGDGATPAAQLSPEMLRQRVLGALAAEGLRLLEQAAVARGGVIDALAVVALGMPRVLGGPLFAADQRGLLLLRRDLQAWARDHAVWAPVPLLDRLVSTGARLADHAPGNGR